MIRTSIQLCRELAGIALVATMLVFATTAFATEYKLGAITVGDPRSRATPGGATVASGYLTIENGATVDDRFVSATAEIAGRTEIHQMSMDGGIMKMRELPDGVMLPAHGSVALEPMSYHLMFLDLKRPLKQGETFAGTLTFEKAGTLDVIFAVEGAGGSSDHHP